MLPSGALVSRGLAVLTLLARGLLLMNVHQRSLPLSPSCKCSARPDVLRTMIDQVPGSEDGFTGPPHHVAQFERAGGIDRKSMRRPQFFVGRVRPGEGPHQPTPRLFTKLGARDYADEMRVDVEETRRVVPVDMNADDQQFEFAMLPQLPEHRVDPAVEPLQVRDKATNLRLPGRVVDRPDAPIGLVGVSRKGREVGGETMRSRPGLCREHAVRAQRRSPINHLAVTLAMQDEVVVSVVGIGRRLCLGVQQPPRKAAGMFVLTAASSSGHAGTIAATAASVHGEGRRCGGRAGACGWSTNVVQIAIDGPSSAAKSPFGSSGWSDCRFWLGNLDSNQDKQSQSLLCYRYTIPQRNCRAVSRACGAVRQWCAKRRVNQISGGHGALLPACDRAWQARKGMELGGNSRGGAWWVSADRSGARRRSGR